MTDSNHRLTRLRMPNDLTEKAILDIGCNEGFFCNESLKRGAKKVVGIDQDQQSLAEARRRYSDPRLTFIHQGWDSLPEGPFDLVLWTSAMHYELDPQKVLNSIMKILTPTGTLILECGVQHSSNMKEMKYILRHDAGLWYPTFTLIENMLIKAGLKFRKVSEGELIGTDPVPRLAFHCKKKLPIVMLITESSNLGKSVLAHQLYPAATKVISLDHFISLIWVSKWAHTPLEKFIKKNTNPNSLDQLFNGIDSNGLTDSYITLLCKGIATTDELVVIEGYMTDSQRQLLANKLSSQSFLWIVDRWQNSRIQ